MRIFSGIFFWGRRYIFSVLASFSLWFLLVSLHFLQFSLVFHWFSLVFHAFLLFSMRFLCVSIGKCNWQGDAFKRWVWVLCVCVWHDFCVWCDAVFHTPHPRPWSYLGLQCSGLSKSSWQGDAFRRWVWVWRMFWHECGVWCGTFRSRGSKQWQPASWWVMACIVVALPQMGHSKHRQPAGCYVETDVKSHMVSPFTVWVLLPGSYDLSEAIGWIDIDRSDRFIDR